MIHLGPLVKSLGHFYDTRIWRGASQQRDLAPVHLLFAISLEDGPHGMISNDVILPASISRGIEDLPGCRGCCRLNFEKLRDEG